MGLGVDGVGGDVRDHLLLLRLEHLLALLGRNLYLALLDDLRRNLGDVLRPEGLLNLVLRGPGALAGVLEDVLNGHVVDYVELLALLDEVEHLGVKQYLESLAVGLEPSDDRVVEIDHLPTVTSSR